MSESIAEFKIKHGDVFAIFIVLLLAVAVLLVPIGGGDSVCIRTDSKTYVYPLYEDRQIDLTENGVSLTVVIKEGSVYVSQTTCRDKICLHTQPIKDGGCIVCLPAHVSIEITDTEADAIAG